MGIAMQINRRDTLKAFLAGIAAGSVPSVAAACPASQLANEQSFTLGNGLRTHYIANASGYVAANWSCAARRSPTTASRICASTPRAATRPAA